MPSHLLARPLKLVGLGLSLFVVAACAGSGAGQSPAGNSTGGGASNAAGTTSGSAGTLVTAGAPAASGGAGGVSGAAAGTGGAASLAGMAGVAGSGGAASAPQTIHLLTFNIKLGSVTSLETIAEVIKASHADVVGLQEVDKGTNRSDQVDEPAALAQLTGMQAFFAPALHDYDGGQYGEAALVAPELHVLEAIPHDLDQTNAGYESRAALELRIARAPDAAKPDFVFITTHWDHIHDAGGNQNRVAQAEHVNRIGEAAAALAPVLLVGDLNDRDASEPLDILRQFWTPAREDYFRIDWIFHHGAGWQVTGVRDMTDADHPQATTASDHLPVIATYTLLPE